MDFNRLTRLLLSLQQVEILCLESLFKYSVWILWLARSWEDFSSGWWHPQHRVPMVLGVFPLENSTHRSNFTLVYWIVHERPSMEFHENHHNCPWQYFRSFDRGLVVLVALKYHQNFGSKQTEGRNSTSNIFTVTYQYRSASSIHKNVWYNQWLWYKNMYFIYAQQHSISIAMQTQVKYTER